MQPILAGVSFKVYRSEVLFWLCQDHPLFMDEAVQLLGNETQIQFLYEGDVLFRKAAAIIFHIR